VACARCGKASWNYCGECCLPCLPPGVRAPAVRLPLRVEVLRGKEETAAKSTASMLAASSPHVRIWQLPAFPPIYPQPDALGVAGFAARHMLPPPGACAASALHAQ
jgi:hypothetical protein